MFILNVVKTLCFDTVLQVLILKGLTCHEDRGRQALILKSLTGMILQEIGCSSWMFEEKRREKYNSDTPRLRRGRRRTRRDRREEWDAVNRASWRLTIKEDGSTDIMQSSSTLWITIRMNCGKLLKRGVVK